jgi:uncharacterized protein YbaR (Trm112 family)
MSDRSERMAIDPRLLSILACPLCKEDIELTADEKGLKCTRCHRVYPIKEGIPVMLIDEATIEPERETKD